MKTPEQRFRSRILLTATCHYWLGAKVKGYGVLNVGKRREAAHHYALILAGVEVPPGAVVLHTCDTPACVNPAHLRVGTQRENLADMRQKGRWTRTSKLTSDDVVEIRRLGEQGVVHRVIAERLGCTQTHVSAIIRGEKRAAVKALCFDEKVL